MEIDEKYKVVDLESAMFRLELSNETLTRLNRKFLSGSLIKQLDEAFFKDDFEGCRLHLHTLKGSAANLGMSGLSLFAATLEAKLKNGEPITRKDMKDLMVLWQELKTRFED
jgi:HPt (histidine-containing phosphotransfer) domain-containing protein